MLAALAALPQAAPDTGLFAAIIVAGGATALVALGMMLLGMHRSSRLTVLRTLGTAGLGIGVIAVAAVGVLAVSPGSALADSSENAPATTTIDEGPDIQLPTLDFED